MLSFVVCSGSWSLDCATLHKACWINWKKRRDLGLSDRKKVEECQKKPRSNRSKPLYHGQPCTEKLIQLPAHPSTLNSSEEESWQKITAGRSGLGSSRGQNLKQNMLKTSPSQMGAPAKLFRLGLGALIIKEKLGISDPWNIRTNSRQPLFTILDRLGDLEQRTAIWPIHCCSFTLRQRISVILVNKVNQKMVLFKWRSLKQLSITLNNHNARIRVKVSEEVIASLRAVAACLMGVDDFRTIWG